MRRQRKTLLPTARGSASCLKKRGKPRQGFSCFLLPNGENHKNLHFYGYYLQKQKKLNFSEPEQNWFF